MRTPTFTYSRLSGERIFRKLGVDEARLKQALTRAKRFREIAGCGRSGR